MLTPELQNYVAASLAAGMTGEQISQALLQQGWDIASVNLALAASQRSSPGTRSRHFLLLAILIPLVFLLIAGGLVYFQRTIGEQPTETVSSTTPSPKNKTHQSGSFTLVTDKDKQEILSGIFTLEANGLRIYATTGGMYAGSEGLIRTIILPGGEIFIEKDAPQKFVRAFPDIPEATYNTTSFARTTYEATGLIIDPVLFKEAIKLGKGTTETSVAFDPLAVLEKHNPAYNYSERGMDQVKRFFSNSKTATVSTDRVSIPTTFSLIGEDSEPATLTFKTSPQSGSIPLPTEQELEEARMKEFSNIIASAIIAQEKDIATFKSADKEQVKSSVATLVATPGSCNSNAIQQLTKVLYPHKDVTLPSQATTWSCSLSLEGEFGPRSIISLVITNSANMKRTYRCSLSYCSQENS